MIYRFKYGSDPAAIGSTLQEMTLSASSALQIDRRGFMRLVTSIAAALTMGCDVVWEDSMPMQTAVKITCFIRYEIDPYQRQAFKEYAEAWGRVVPRCGGQHHAHIRALGTALFARRGKTWETNWTMEFRHAL